MERSRPDAAGSPLSGGAGRQDRMTREPWLWIGLGLALATGATLMLEIVLIRIFSVVLWYHYGFLTISLALLGVGLAGIAVYLYPERFSRARATRTTAWAALLFVATTLATLATIQWIVGTREHFPLGVGSRVAIFLVTLVPFFFAGLCVAIPISRYTERIGALYAADLIGAAAGALLVVPLIGQFGGLATVVLCAGLGAVAAGCFAHAAGHRATLALAGLALLACSALLPLGTRADLFRIVVTKSVLDDKIIGERWNSFSRVTVYAPRRKSFGWNLGAGAPRVVSPWSMIRIDAGAGTPMLSFKGDLRAVDYLRYDVSAFGYRVRPHQSALVIGSGGGRDILTAKLLGVEKVQAVEVNPLVVGFVREDFRNFTGSPYDLPGVSFEIEDGRTYVARSRDRYDMIQISAVDTTAALAAGALSLVENSLYTVEAFEDYHDRLSDAGLLAITRNWTMNAQLMALRTADIMQQAWRSRGVEHPERHLVIIAPGEGPARWGTLLASRQPFEAAELDRIRTIASELGFRILYEPGAPTNPPDFGRLLGPERERLLAEHPFDVTASTDDRPFFFFFYKPFKSAAASSGHRADENFRWAARQTPRILMQTFVLVSALVVVLAFGVPILLGRLRLGDARATGRGLVYFAAIGLGFILVEISLIQRGTLLLGQPLYAFSGILGSILVFSGLGSLCTQAISADRLVRASSLALAALVVAVVAHALLMPDVLHGAMRLDLSSRLLITIVSVAPLGFVMGMPLPLGMRMLERTSPRGLAWAWGVNGSLSVLGTVLAMTVSVFFGITVTMLAGAAAYLVAVPVFATGSLNRPPPHS